MCGTLDRFDAAGLGKHLCGTEPVCAFPLLPSFLWVCSLPSIPGVGTHAFRREHPAGLKGMNCRQPAIFYLQNEQFHMVEHHKVLRDQMEQ